MAWAYPRHRFVQYGIIDVDDFNDNLVLFATEYAYLNESNWAADTLDNHQAVGQTADDVAMSIYQTATIQDPFSGGGGVDIPQTLSWYEVPNTSKTFRSRGGQVEVVCSFQLSNEPTNTSSKQTGLMFCIGLNGTPRMDSLLGSGDLGNDQKERPQFKYDATTGGFDAVAATYYGTGPAVKVTQGAYAVQLLARVEPGEHTVALYARNLAMDSGATSGISQSISQRETYVKEMWS